MNGLSIDPRRLGMYRVCLAVALAMVATACVAQRGPSSTQEATAVAMQEPGGSQAGAAASIGEKTVTGCIGKGSPSGFVINTADGRSLPLFTDRDLSSLVGQQVQIRTKWRRTGMTVTEEAAEKTPDKTADTGDQSTAPKTASQGNQQFAGSISMTFSGKVMGPCPKK
jgi:hypothetical protein